MDFKNKLPEGVQGTHGWNVGDFIRRFNLHARAREVYDMFHDLDDEEMIDAIYEWCTDEGWEILGSEYEHIFPSEEEDHNRDYCDVVKINHEDVIAEAKSTLEGYGYTVTKK